MASRAWFLIAQPPPGTPRRRGRFLGYRCPPRRCRRSCCQYPAPSLRSLQIPLFFLALRTPGGDTMVSVSNPGLLVFSQQGERSAGTAFGRPTAARTNGLRSLFCLACGSDVQVIMDKVLPGVYKKVGVPNPGLWSFHTKALTLWRERIRKATAPAGNRRGSPFSAGETARRGAMRAWQYADPRPLRRSAHHGAPWAAADGLNGVFLLTPVCPCLGQAYPFRQREGADGTPMECGDRSRRLGCLWAGKGLGAAGAKAVSAAAPAWRP